VDKALDAVSRRDAHALDISGSGGNSQGPGSRPMDAQAALKELETIDEMQAVTDFRKGDRTLLDRMNKARETLQMAPIVL
jgi:hypothetical protein